MSLPAGIPSTCGSTFRGEELPDTITGRITYLKHDSLNQLVPNTDKLKLFWKYIETKEEERAREKEEKERERAEREGETYTPPEKPNPFKYNLSARGEINPEDNVTISSIIRSWRWTAAVSRSCVSVRERICTG